MPRLGHCKVHPEAIPTTSNLRPGLYSACSCEPLNLNLESLPLCPKLWKGEMDGQHRSRNEKQLLLLNALLGAFSGF